MVDLNSTISIAMINANGLYTPKKEEINRIDKKQTQLYAIYER